MAFGGVHPFMLKAAGSGPPDPPGGTGVIWDVTKWRCDKGKPNWDLDGKRFLGSSQLDPPTSQVNSTIANGYGESTHYAEFLVSVNDVITGPGVVSPSWHTGTCSSDSPGATPTSSLQSYMTDQASGTWKVGGYINANYGNVSIASTSVSNRIGIEVDVGSNEVRFYEVESDGTRTELGDGVGEFDGVDFDPDLTGTPQASWAATSYTDGDSIQIYSESDDWWGTPTSGYVAMTSD